MPEAGDPLGEGSRFHTCGFVWLSAWHGSGVYQAMREQVVQAAGLWASEGEPSSPFMSLLWV